MESQKTSWLRLICRAQWGLRYSNIMPWNISQYQTSRRVSSWLWRACINICANESAAGGPLLFLLKINQVCHVTHMKSSVIQWTGIWTTRIAWLTTMHQTLSMIRITQYKGKKVVHDRTNLLGIMDKRSNGTIIFTLFNALDILILWLFSPKRIHLDRIPDVTKDGLYITHFSRDVFTLTSHKWLQTMTVTNNKTTSPRVFFYNQF